MDNKYQNISLTIIIFLDFTKKGHCINESLYYLEHSNFSREREIDVYLFNEDMNMEHILD